MKDQKSRYREHLFDREELYEFRQYLNNLDNIDDFMPELIPIDTPKSCQSKSDKKRDKKLFASTKSRQKKLENKQKQLSHR